MLELLWEKISCGVYLFLCYCLDKIIQLLGSASLWKQEGAAQPVLDHSLPAGDMALFKGQMLEEDTPCSHSEIQDLLDGKSHIKHENPAVPSIRGVADPGLFLMCLKTCPDGPLERVCCFTIPGDSPAGVSPSLGQVGWVASLTGPGTK